MRPTDAHTAAIRAHAEVLDIPGQAVIGTTLDGRIVYWNRGATKLYGWSAAEALGRDVLEITPADLTRDQAGNILRELKEGRTWSGEFRVRARNGKEFTAHVRDTPVRDAAGELVGIVGVSVCVDEPKRSRTP